MMHKTQIVVSIIVAAAVGGAVAQAPQGVLTGNFGDTVSGSATAEFGIIDGLDHRLSTTGGPDVFVGATWGRAFDGGAVFKREKVKLTVSTFPSPCNLNSGDLLESQEAVHD